MQCSLFPFTSSNNEESFVSSTHLCIVNTGAAGEWLESGWSVFRMVQLPKVGDRQRHLQAITRHYTCSQLQSRAVNRRGLWLIYGWKLKKQILKWIVPHPYSTKTYWIKQQLLFSALINVLIVFQSNWWFVWSGNVWKSCKKKRVLMSWSYLKLLFKAQTFIFTL